MTDAPDGRINELITAAGARRLTVEEVRTLRAGVERLRRQHGAERKAARHWQSRAKETIGRIEAALDIAADASEYLYPRDAIDGISRALRGVPPRPGDRPRIDRG